MRQDARNADTIFAQAIELASPEERAAFLENACANDPELRREVEKLVDDYFRAGEFLERPVAHIVGTVDQPLTDGRGSRIGPYKLLQKLGEGGMGTVWVAEQTEPVKRRVALKVIKPGMDSTQVLRRFEAERQALALMDHTHIAKVFDAGTTAEGRPYFVMELVKGAPITKYCDELHLPIRERLELFVPVCQAIQHAHQKGIIHRDVKPSNVLVAIQDGKPIAKVIDFGVAKALHQRLTEESVYTEIGQMVGTLEYMSPEQAELSVLDIDTRADIYALGAVLYELLTGSTPVDRKRLHNAAFAEMLRMIKEEEPPKPSTRLTQSKESLVSLAVQRRTEPAKLAKAVRGELDWIVMKCLEKDRTRRYDTANSLARDVERYLHDEPVEACPPSAGYRLRKYARKYRMPMAVAAAFVLLLVAGVVVSAWQALRATQAEGEALVQRDLATDAEAEATKKRQVAEAAQEWARTAEAKANQEAERAQREAYTAKIRLMQPAWDCHNMLQLQDLLDETGVFPERGFEWYYWQRQYHVEHLTLVGHRGAVTAVAFAPDGQRLVTGGADGTIRFWDGADGRELLCLRGHRSEITAVAFAPDGQRLVTGSTDGTVRFWDATSHRELRALEMHAGPVWAVAVSPDGKRFVTGCDDGTARVWDAASGRELFTLQGQTARPVFGASLVGLLSSPPAQGPFRAASALGAGSSGHTGAVWAVAWTPDSQRVITGGDDGTAKIWGCPLTQPSPPHGRGRGLGEGEGGPWLTLTGHTDPVLSVAVTPDGKRVVTGSGDSTAKIWDTATGRALLTLQGRAGDVCAVAVSPDGQRLMTGYQFGLVKVWDTASGREVLTLMGHKVRVSSIAVGPDGSRLLTGSWDGTARVWDTASGRSTLSLREHTGPVTCTALTPDGQRVVTGSDDGTAKIWDLLSGRKLLTLQGHTGPVRSVTATPDGRRLVTGSDDRTARVWDPASGRPLLTLTGHTDLVRAVAVTPDSQRLLTGSDDGTAGVWDLTQGGPPLRILTGRNGPVSAVAVSPDGQWLVTGNYDGTVKIWDAASGGELRTLKVYNWAVNAVAVTPDGRRLVTASSDRTVTVWDMTSGGEMLSLKGHSGPVQSVAVTPDGQRIVTAGADGTAKIWDAVSGRELLTLREFTGSVSSVAVTADGRRLVTGNEDGTATIWQAATPAQVTLWAGQAHEAERRLAVWQRPLGSAPGFIQNWLVLAPLPLEPNQRGALGLEREQISGEDRLRPRAGDAVRVGGRECTWQAYRAEEPVLDFNRFVGKLTDHSVAYAVCYVISEADRNDLLLQVGSDDQAKVYLNGQEVYQYTRPRSLVALDPIGPVRLRKGTNVLVFKVVNESLDWLGCLRFVDAEGLPAKGLRVSLTPGP